MAARRRPKYEPVDYMRQKHERKKMTNYLRTGNYRKAAGVAVTLSAERRRYILWGIALALLSFGMFFAIF